MPHGVRVDLEHVVDLALPVELAGRPLAAGPTQPPAQLPDPANSVMAPARPATSDSRDAGSTRTPQSASR